ncbi:MAG TPA: hypothetical protein VFF15_05525 [Flavobacteriaceae bacterium]|nr:hypothetical protein [Flavobacteriaceae bacterium]
MKVNQSVLPLFNQFIKDSKSGKRLKKNGGKISNGTIENYRYTLNNLEEFCNKTNFDLHICDVNKLTLREKKSEKNYWKKFYKKYPIARICNPCPLRI